MRKIIFFIIAVSIIFIIDEICPADTIGKRRNSIQEINCAYDDIKDTIIIKWEKLKDVNRYRVFRSPLKSGPYVEIGAANNRNSFEDTTAEPGLQYWYRVSPLLKGIVPGRAVPCHIRIRVPKGLDIETLLKNKIKPKPKFNTKKERKKVKRHLSFLKKHYKNPLKLTFILYIAKLYINRGIIIAFDNFKDYEIDYLNRKLLLKHQDNKYHVLFYSGKFLRLFLEIKESNGEKSDNKKLIDILINNSIVYCLYIDEKKIVDKDGYTRFIPYLEAIGLSTEYFKNYRNWRSNTILFGTGNKELDKKIKEARRRFYKRTPY